MIYPQSLLEPPRQVKTDRLGTRSSGRALDNKTGEEILWQQIRQGCSSLRARAMRGQPVEPDPDNTGAGSVFLFGPYLILVRSLFFTRGKEDDASKERTLERRPPPRLRGGDLPASRRCRTVPPARGVLPAPVPVPETQTLPAGSRPSADHLGPDDLGNGGGDGKGRPRGSLRAAGRAVRPALPLERVRQQLPLLRFPQGQPGRRQNHPLSRACGPRGPLPGKEGVSPSPAGKRGNPGKDRREVHRGRPESDLPRDGDAHPARQRRTDGRGGPPGPQGGGSGRVPGIPGDIPPGDVRDDAPFRPESELRLAPHLHGPCDAGGVRGRRGRRPPRTLRLPVRGPLRHPARGIPSGVLRDLPAHDLRAAVQVGVRIAAAQGAPSGLRRGIRENRDRLPALRPDGGRRRDHAGAGGVARQGPEHRGVADQRGVEDRPGRVRGRVSGASTRSSSSWTIRARSRRSSG